MNNPGKVIGGIIIIILLGLLFYSFKDQPASPVPSPATSSIVGCYVARLSKDVYVLKVNSVTDANVTGVLAFNNYQKDSSSGEFTGTYDGSILLGNYSFDSEGMHSDRQVIFKKNEAGGFNEGFGPIKVEGSKEVFEDLSKVTYDQKFTFSKVENCQEHYSDANVTFLYNAFFAANGGNQTPTTDWNPGSKNQGTLLASVTVPRGYLPKTNFVGARLTAGRSNVAGEIKNCTVVGSIEKSGGTATVSGFPFTKFTSSEAAAGNWYVTTSYRGIVDGDCYAVGYTIHSTNIANYPTDSGITPFDQTKMQSDLETTVKSLKFLVNSD